MSSIALRIQNISKKYRIGTVRHDTLRDQIAHIASSIFQRTKNSKVPSSEIWALKDVSFNVHHGEIVGIIGRNGAGKSTLLKILSRITAPTSGRVEIYGRVGSLLEVGTGFHPELTGRENIYLNGAILGMSRDEINRKFDEIVAFSEIEKFLDTPVKRYSSGMYVRLAFAVAAHFEPEILLVDEVLSVGDITFQKKCLGKMGEVSREGRTVIFVSHNLTSIEHLCNKTIVLNNGKISYSGETSDSVQYYLQETTELSKQIRLKDREDRKGDGKLKFTKVSVFDKQGNELKNVISGQDLIIRCYYSSNIEIVNAEVHVSIVIRDGLYALSNLNSINSSISELPIYYKGSFECRWNKFNLSAGSYICSVYCSIKGKIADWVESAFIIDVEDGDFYNSGKLITIHGKVLIEHSWTSREITN